MIKVVFIHQDGLISGSAISLLQILKSIDKNKFAIKVICQNNGPFIELLNLNNIDCCVVKGSTFVTSPTPSIINRDYFYDLLALKGNKNLERKLKEYNPDIVHINDKSALIAGKIAKKLGYKIVWHLRSSYAGKKSKLLYYISKFIIAKSSNHLISISEDELDGFEHLSNISIINNSIDLDEANKVLTNGSSLNNEYNIMNNEITVGMIGNLNKQKGAWNFLHAAGLAQKLEPKIKFRFFVIAPTPQNLNYGWRGMLGLIDTTNPYEKAISIARDNQILNQTVFTNRRNDILNIMAGLDIVSAVYNLEAIGRPGFEASAVGKPVIVNKGHSGNSTIVKNNITGLCIEKENPEALANAFVFLAKNKDIRNTLGQNGLEHARENFDASKNIKKIEAIYESLINNTDKFS